MLATTQKETVCFFQKNYVFIVATVLICNFSTDTGNEKVVRNIKIKGDYLKEVDDTGKLGQALTFYFQSHEECRAECASRYGTCFL